jgi:glutamate---cysteine ligase / carboxylate-amine ligase
MVTAAERVCSVGVEEEFLLVHAGHGRTVPEAGRVLAHAGRHRPPEDGNAYKRELLTSQVEAASGVCGPLGDLAAHLMRGRHLLAGAARACGAVLLPSGTPPLAGGRAAPSEGERFAAITARYAEVVADYQVCGCHVHVGVPDRETAVAVVNRLRPWLPTLLALSANSPYRHGRDTGYASWRMVEQRRFPGSGVPPLFASAAGQEAEIARLVDCGVLADPQMSFWLARPSPRFPTVEFRTADTAATADDALLQAALSRALVRAALDDVVADDAVPQVGEQVAAAAVWSAARYGLRGPAVDPWRGRRVPAGELVRALVTRVGPALEEAGDLALVRRQLARLELEGTGADRQRAAGPDSPGAAVRALAADALRDPAGLPEASVSAAGGGAVGREESGP